MHDDDQILSLQDVANEWKSRELLVRQGYYLAVGRAGVLHHIPKACEHLPLPVATRQPDYSTAVNMPGGVSASPVGRFLLII
jgi:hypothetical protein